MAMFPPLFIRSNEISRLQNVSPYVSLIFVYKLVGSHNYIVFCYRPFPINYYVHTIVSLPSVSLYVTSSQRFSVHKYVRRFISLHFSTLFQLYVSTFTRHCSALPKVFSVLVHSYDESILLSRVSLHVSMFIQY